MIEIALAGFSKDDIEIELTEGNLAVRSKKEEETNENNEAKNVSDQDNNDEGSELEKV